MIFRYGSAKLDSTSPPMCVLQYKKMSTSPSPEPESAESKQNLMVLVLVPLVTALIGALAVFWATLDNTAIGEARGERAAREALLPTISAYETQSAQPPGTAAPLPPQALNLIRRYDFETTTDELINLGICDGEQADWWSTCREAPDRLKLVEGGYTGQRSLACEAELLPQTRSVYTIKFPLDPPILVDALSANVYLEPTTAVPVSFAAFVVEDGIWQVSGAKAERAGWVRLVLDLRSASTAETRLVSEVHIDVFLPATMDQSREITMRVDDLELYYYGD